MKCVVVNCNKSNEGKASDCSFFRFPPDGTLRKKWINFCGEKKFNPNTSFVCMHHFKAEDFGNNLQYEMGFAKKRLLKDGVVPTINIAYTKNNELHEHPAQGIDRRKTKKTGNLLHEHHSSGLMRSQGSDILQSTESIGTNTKVDNIDTAIENIDIKSECIDTEIEIIDIKMENIDDDIEVENIDATIENIDIKMESIDEVEKKRPEKQSKEVLSSDLSCLHNLNLKVDTLEKEIIVLRKEQKINDVALKTMKDKMERIDKIQKYDMEQMKKCLAKAKFELARVEEKLQVIFTKGQIKKLKNGFKRQTWSEDDVAHCFTLYAISPKMYKFLYRNQFPLPAVRTLQSWSQKLQVTRGLIK